MIAEKGRWNKLFYLGENDSVLEIMSSEDKELRSLTARVREVETIETDPGVVCSAAWRNFHSNRGNHFIFCGKPYVFLQKKIENKAKVDAVIVNSDRMEMPEKIWNLVGILNPVKVILTFCENENGEYHKKLMEANGFKIIKQEGDFENGISEKFCVGCGSKRNSK